MKKFVKGWLGIGLFAIFAEIKAKDSEENKDEVISWKQCGGKSSRNQVCRFL